jgi:hypothetical protein
MEARNMESRKSAIVILPLAWIVASCGSGESRWTGTITDSAGVTIVSNTDVGIWAPGDEWTFEEELRFGVLEGAPEYEFGEVSRITVDSKGRIFVLDNQAQHIRVYSPDGAYEQTVGARGQGPGELLYALTLLMGPGDTLLVPDWQNRRFNRYAPDGSRAGSSRIAPEEGWPMAFRATASGVLAEQISFFRAIAEQAGSPDAIVRLATDGTVTDTFITLQLDESRLGDPFRVVYTPELVWDFTDDLQLILAINDEYRIGVYSDGQLNRIIAKPFELRPIGDQDKEEFVSFLVRRWANLGVPASSVAEMRNEIRFADFYPAFSSVVAGPMGTIWVQHVRSASELGEGILRWVVVPEYDGVSDWDVFDSEGRLLGVITMPQLFTPILFRGDKIYGVWRDELDVQYVVRLRIVGDLGIGAT